MPVDVVAWALGIHVVVLPFSLAGLYRYSDRSDLFAKSIGDTDDLLARMQRQVATAIEDELAPVFDRAEGEPQIVRPDGYSERPANPVRSDAFQEAVRRFVYSDAPALVDYGRARRARSAWCFWARVLSWTVLGLNFWEVLCIAILGLIGKLSAIEIPEYLASWSFAPTAVFVLAFFSCQAGLLRHHDVIHDNKNQYPDL